MDLLNTTEKARVVAAYARAYPTHRTFIETGTGYGLLTAALALTFDRIVSIEILPERAAEARQRCASWDNIGIIAGSSEDELRGVLADVGPSIIFLDAHEDSLPESEANSALDNELLAIDLSPYAEDHIVLIDDARLCREGHGWVSLDGIREWGGHHGLAFEVADDIVRLTP